MLQLSSKFRNTVLWRLFGLLIMFGITESSQALPVAEVDYNLATDRACFPMENLQEQAFYDVCIVLDSISETAVYLLESIIPAQHELADIPRFSQAEGLIIPCLRLSDGRVFTDVHFNVLINTADGETYFELDGGRRIRRNPEHSIARLWSEAMIDGIRLDVERPPVHARDLFHAAVAMYDVWTVFDQSPAESYMLDKAVHGYYCDLGTYPVNGETLLTEQETAISYAVYRLLRHRFANIPRAADAARVLDDMMIFLGLDREENSRDYGDGSGAALGNHIADCLIEYGLGDGANEAERYLSGHYAPVNAPFKADLIGNPGMTDPDRWQPITFEEFRDKNGNVFLGSSPAFVTPEWGRVLPFALTEDDLSIYQRDDTDWYVYHDPGPPALLADSATAAEFRWNHELVVLWSSHLDPNDGVLIDISPNNIGNVLSYPPTQEGLVEFYDGIGGGDASTGHAINPATGAPYPEQLVPMGDYTRALVEFYGPDSNTMPGRWIEVFNTVSDHPLLEKRFMGQGTVLDGLEWDIKGYFALAAAMHDVAITTWGIKGWYDSSRPVSVLRYMTDRGQSSNPEAANYHPEGIDLIPGYIETVEAGDALAGENDENVGKIKFYAWRGTWQVPDPEVDVAGVGWVLAEEWVPYMRPTFVTPPFGGYMSGHSTFSRAVAEIMTLYTGDAFHPGGLREVVIKKDSYLKVERGPSTDITLQWATYRDMADQSGLARIWGGVHPPMDDIVGRNIGERVGVDAFNKAESLFLGVGGP